MPGRLAPELIATAKAQRWDPVEVIKALFVEEVAGRGRSMLATRRKAAGFPTGKTFAAWDADGVLHPRPHPASAADPGMGPPPGEPGRLRPVGDREDVLPRSPRPSRRRDRTPGRLVHPRRPRRPGPRPPHRRHRHQSRRPDPARRPGRRRRHRAAAGLPRRRRRPLPHRRRRLRETLHRAELQPAPVRVRRADAENAGHRHRRPAPPPRPRLPNQRRLGPPHPSPHRERSQPPHLNPAMANPATWWADQLAITGHFSWPPAGRSTDRRWAESPGP